MSKFTFGHRVPTVITSSLPVGTEPRGVVVPESVYQLPTVVQLVSVPLLQKYTVAAYVKEGKVKRSKEGRIRDSENAIIDFFIEIKYFVNGIQLLAGT